METSIWFAADEQFGVVRIDAAGKVFALSNRTKLVFVGTLQKHEYPSVSWPAEERPGVEDCTIQVESQVKCEASFLRGVIDESPDDAVYINLDVLLIGSSVTIYINPGGATDHWAVATTGRVSGSWVVLPCQVAYSEDVRFEDSQLPPSELA